MRELDLTFKGFDAAVCLFDSIGYAVTNEASSEPSCEFGITSSRRILLTEFWHAPPMLCHFDPFAFAVGDHRWPSGPDLDGRPWTPWPRSLRVEYSVSLSRHGTGTTWSEST